MGRIEQFTVQQMIDACPGTGGIMAVVAKKLECSRSTIARRAKRHPTLQRALDDADEEATDLAEAKAIKLINAEYWPAIRDRLRTKGKDRGYTERREVAGPGGGPVKTQQVPADFSNLTDEELDAYIAICAKLSSGDTGA